MRIVEEIEVETPKAVRFVDCHNGQVYRGCISNRYCVKGKGVMVYLDDGYVQADPDASYIQQNAYLTITGDV